MNRYSCNLKFSFRAVALYSAIVIGSIGVVFEPAFVCADEGMWTFDNPPTKQLQARYGRVPLYHAIAPMELARFRYCQAVAAVLRLSTFGMMQARGPVAVGYRPEAIANVIPDVVRLLTRYASRKAGVPVSIEVNS